jgi:hypothetical protein
MSEPISIFNVGQHAEEMNSSMFFERGKSNVFDPKVEKVGDTCAFVIRPIPYVKNPYKSMISKAFYALNDPAGVILFDSKTTFNRPAEQHYEFCPVSDLWLRMHNSQDPNIKALEGWLRLQRANYCYVQIIQFPKDETLNGQIRVMRVPAEMVKLMDSMAKPSDDDLKLGAVPVQPFDLYKGKKLKCTITGKDVKGTLMRDWKVEVQGESCEALFPLGPNGAMTPLSQLKQEDVLKYFEESQEVDLEQTYGYHEPNADTKFKVKQFLMTKFGAIPGFAPIITSYFPEIHSQIAPGTEPGAQGSVQQPAPQPLPGNGPSVIQGQNPMEAAQQAAENQGQQGAEGTTQAPASEPAPAGTQEAPGTQAPAPETTQAPAGTQEAPATKEPTAPVLP